MITNALLKNFLKKVTLLQFTKSAIEMFKVNNGLLVQVVSENFQRSITILDINQEQNLRLIMLILKHMGSNLYHISDLKPGIPYRKKKKHYKFGTIQN